MVYGGGCVVRCGGCEAYGGGRSLEVEPSGFFLLLSLCEDCFVFPNAMISYVCRECSILFVSFCFFLFDEKII